jgi:hypothetical protein
VARQVLTAAQTPLFGSPGTVSVQTYEHTSNDLYIVRSKQSTNVYIQWENCWILALCLLVLVLPTAVLRSCDFHVLCSEPSALLAANILIFGQFLELEHSASTKLGALFSQ